jgi:hypothetical protein
VTTVNSAKPIADETYPAGNYTPYILPPLLRSGEWIS